MMKDNLQTAKNRLHRWFFLYALFRPMHTTLTQEVGFYLEILAPKVKPLRRE